MLVWRGDASELDGILSTICPDPSLRRDGTREASESGSYSSIDSMSTVILDKGAWFDETVSDVNLDVTISKSSELVEGAESPLLRWMVRSLEVMLYYFYDCLLLCAGWNMMERKLYLSLAFGVSLFHAVLLL